MLFLSASISWAKSTLLLGALSKSNYVYSGAAGKSIFFEGTTHDLRMQAGGLCGYETRLRNRSLTAALFAGGIYSTNYVDYRAPLSSASLHYYWQPHRDWETNAQLLAEFGPFSTGAAGLSGTNSLALHLALLAMPSWSTTYHASRNDYLSAQVTSQFFNLFVTNAQLAEGNVGAAYGIQPELIWEHQLSRQMHFAEMRALGRVMNARSTFNPDVVLLTGGQVGYSYRRENRLNFHLAAGAAKLFNFPYSQLNPIEPLAGLSLDFFTRRLIYQIEANSMVRENIYFGGLPQRLAQFRLGLVKPPRNTTWRINLDGIGEWSRYATGRVVSRQRDGHDLYRARIRTRVSLPLGLNWRLFAEGAANYGLEKRDVPTECAAGAACPETGLYFSGGLGVAYLDVNRAADENIIAEVY